MNRFFLGVAVAALGSASLWAHHSAAAEYDASRLLVLQGVVTRFDWMNPHVYCRIRAKNAKGVEVEWNLEMGSPNGMRRQGWLPKTIQPGDSVTVEAFAAKDSPSGGKTHRVKVPDGRWLFADASGPEQ
jgi:hypothetical protein